MSKVFEGITLPDDTRYARSEYAEWCVRCAGTGLVAYGVGYPSDMPCRRCRGRGSVDVVVWTLLPSQGEEVGRKEVENRAEDNSGLPPTSYLLPPSAGGQP